jgi:hypothetical protein
MVAGCTPIAGPGVAANFLDGLQAKARHGLDHHILGDLEAMTEKLRWAAVATFAGAEAFHERLARSMRAGRRASD